MTASSWFARRPETIHLSAEGTTLALAKGRESLETGDLVGAEHCLNAASILHKSSFKMLISMDPSNSVHVPDDQLPAFMTAVESWQRHAVELPRLRAALKSKRRYASSSRKTQPRDV